MFINSAKANAARIRRAIRHDSPLPPDLEFIERIVLKIPEWRAHFSDGPFLLVLDRQRPDALGSFDGTFDLAKFGPPVANAVYICDDLMKKCHRYPGLLNDPARHHEAATLVQPATETYCLIDPQRSRFLIACKGFSEPLLLNLPATGGGNWDEEAFSQKVDEFVTSYLSDSPVAELVFEGDGIKAGGRDRYRDALYLFLCNSLNLQGVSVRTQNMAVYVVSGNMGAGKKLAAAWAVGSKADRPWQWTEEHSKRYLGFASALDDLAGVEAVQICCITSVEDNNELVDSSGKIHLRHVA